VDELDRVDLLGIDVTLRVVIRFALIASPVNQVSPLEEHEIRGALVMGRTP